MRRPGAGWRNVRTVETLVVEPDAPHAAWQAALDTRTIAEVNLGQNSGHLLTGDKGSPQKTWRGPMPDLQNFTGGAGMVNITAPGGYLRVDPEARWATHGAGDVPGSDAVFAARMNRRRRL